MRIKVSISVEEELLKQVDEIVNEGRYRSKSHIMEYALKSFLSKGLK